MVALNASHEATPYLLPTAPEALVAAVRRQLASAETGDSGPAVRSPNGQSSNGQSRLAHRSPWQLLHVDSSAPQSVVDIAYRIWRETCATSFSPFVVIEPPAARVDNPAAVRVDSPPAARLDNPPAARNGKPPADAQVQEHADADDRVVALGALATEATIPSAASNGAMATPAVIESLSGSRCFGIGCEPLRIGTDPGCDVEISASDRAEARIWPHGTGYMLRVAAGSLLVNGVAADCVVLDDGDILEIGDAAFRFRRQTH